MAISATELTIRGRSVREDDDGFVCVNDIHKAAGFSKNQRPTDFIRLPQAIAILPKVHELLVGKSHQFKLSNVWRSKSGPTGGTFAHPIIALAYAEYLSPALAVEVREVFLRYKRGDATLADDVLERASAEANEWAARRAMGRVIRNQFTQQLDKRGVADGWQYGAITNETYLGLFDKKAKELKVERGVSEHGNLRDKMSMAEIAFVAASEALSVERMEDEGAHGYPECKTATTKASSAIRSAIERDRKDRQKRLT